MRSGLALSGLLHAAVLVLLLTLPAIQPKHQRETPQPLVEFTYFDSATAIEVEIDEVISEDALESAELQDPVPEDVAEQPPEVLPEELPEELAEEAAQEEAAPEPEPEVLAESEVAPEPEAPAIEETETVVEAPEEPPAETEEPALAETTEPVELTSPPEDVLAQPEEATPPETAVAEADLAEAEPVETSLAEAPSEPLVPALPEEPTATADATPEPLEPLDQAAAEPLVTTAPPTVEQLPAAESPEPTPAEDPNQPLLLAEPVRPAPNLLPPRRPESIAERPVVIEEEIIAAPRPAPAEPAQPQQSAALPSDPTRQYQPRWQGRVSGNQLLDNLAMVGNEAAQAEANPALWEVVRLLRQQIRECWRLGRPGQSNPDFVVEMEVKLSRSGAVAHAHILDVARMVDNPGFADFARNARSAFQRCSPYALPDDRYAIWNSFVLRFLARGQGIAGR